MASTSSLRQITIPSYVTDRVTVDSGAAHSACPSYNASEHEVRDIQHKMQFQTASGELLEHHGEKIVPYMTQDTVMGITYQVTDVERPVAAVSSMNDGGMTVLFFHHKATGFAEEGESHFLVGFAERWSAAYDGFEEEQVYEQVEKIEGNPVLEDKR